MGRLDGSYRIRAHSSTDEWWLALALGPGLAGGCLLRWLFAEPVWVVTGWTITWLLLASAGTAWSWTRHRRAHLFFLVFYFALATAAVIVGVVASRWAR